MSNHHHHDDDEDQGVSPILKALFEMFSAAGKPDPVVTHVSEAHRQWHRDMIQHWERGREILERKFGTQTATDLIELQRINYRFCANGQSGMSRLLSVATDIMVASDGDPAALGPIVAKLENVLGAIAQDRMEAMARAKKPKPKPKPPSKPKPEPRPKTKPNAHTRAEAEAEAARLRAEAESN